VVLHALTHHLYSDIYNQIVIPEAEDKFVSKLKAAIDLSLQLCTPAHRTLQYFE
jgi:hypothetical protein